MIKKNIFIVLIFKVLEIIILLKYKTGIEYTQINVLFEARSILK